MLHSRQVQHVAFLEDNHLLSVTSNRVSVQQLPLKPRTSLDEIAGRGWLDAAAISANTGLVALPSNDGEILIWDSAHDRVVERLQGSPTADLPTDKTFDAVAFSADGTLVAARRRAGLNLWNRSTGECQTLLAERRYLLAANRTKLLPRQLTPLFRKEHISIVSCSGRRRSLVRRFNSLSLLGCVQLRRSIPLRWWWQRE